LKQKRKRAREIKKLLDEDIDDIESSGRWAIVTNELRELSDAFSKSPLSKRRTKILGDDSVVEYKEEDFIVDEDCHVLVSSDGWVKRQRQIQDPAKSRIRQGDSVLACVAGSTRSSIAFFSSTGVCYTTRMADIPQSTGFGEPIQKLFKLADGEKIVAVLSLDPRVIGNISEDPESDYCPEIHGFAASADGYALRFALATFAEPSTRSGRRFARPKKGQSIIDVVPVTGTETILAVSAACRAMVCAAEEVNYLAGAGKGVMLIRLANDDRLLGFKASTADRDLLLVETNRGAQKTISTAKYRVTSRGGRGTEIQKNGRIAKIIHPPIASPEIPGDD
ncbi:MAG: DNA gyrase C-terminal beta-propeller domain-containing protein, partial [Planctomycetota bacterium]